MPFFCSLTQPFAQICHINSEVWQGLFVDLFYFISFLQEALSKFEMKNNLEEEINPAFQFDLYFS